MKKNQKKNAITLALILASVATLSATVVKANPEDMITGVVQHSPEVVVGKMNPYSLYEDYNHPFVIPLERSMTVEIYNLGGYVANYHASWVDPQGLFVKSQFTSVPLFQTRTFTIPEGASYVYFDITVNGAVKEVPVVDHYLTNEELNLADNDKISYQIWGTYFAPKWSSSVSLN